MILKIIPHGQNFRNNDMLELHDKMKVKLLHDKTRGKVIIQSVDSFITSYYYYMGVLHI